MKRAFIVGAALFALAGCSSGEVKLGVDVAPIKVASTASAKSADSSFEERTALELTRVRLLVAHAKVGYAGGRGCDSEETEIGPQVIDLSADEILNGAHREFDLGKLPSGTYRGAEIEIMPLEADQDASDESFADFKASGASMLVDGFYLGNPFTFAGRWLAEQGTDGEVEIDESTPLSLTMTVDSSSWFKDAESVTLDPTNVDQHEAMSVAICKTLDTQPQLTEGPKPDGSKPMKGHHRPGGGPEHVHCVEGTP
jgi:hypothetical protein